MKDGRSVVMAVVLVGVFVFALVLTWMFAMPQYRVWAAGLEGEALLRRAEHEKQIQIEQAKAEVEAAKLRAEAIQTVGEVAQKYPEYRHQEFIGAFAEALQNGTIDQIIYIPTEAGIPITEAGSLNR
ncbi:hypothetical protein KOR42_22990 [Thalassoglobus neptunius]|uniref:Uncharacterized protein n=2 Tax=Thalassoglobus neptunius TaxID=1938619 RepID=A0A5C5XAM1_9PLAN|nr:hypothetical protein KOR42_22990 [Thalassoglobus neptunius]